MILQDIIYLKTFLSHRATETSHIVYGLAVTFYPRGARRSVGTKPARDLEDAPCGADWLGHRFYGTDTVHNLKTERHKKQR